MFYKTTIWIAIAIICTFPGPATHADIVDIDLANWETWGDFTSTANSGTTVFLAPNAQIEAIQWINLEVDSGDTSWLSEFVISVNDSANAASGGTFWDFKPDPTTEATGIYAGSGSFDSVNSEFGSGPFSVLADGNAFVYVYESFDDGGEAAKDADVIAGTLRITFSAVPEPSSLILLSTVAILFGTRRRKLS